MRPDYEPRVGMRVVCVKKDAWHAHSGAVAQALPRYGQVYTVREVVSTDFGPAVRLMEIINPVCPSGARFDDDSAEPAFAAYRFRPLDERRLDIFRAALNPRPVKEAAPAGALQSKFQNV